MKTDLAADEQSRINRTIADELKHRFPWIGTEADAGSGTDVIQELVEWYHELRDQKGED